MPIPIYNERPPGQASPHRPQQGEAIRMPDLYGKIRTKSSPTETRHHSAQKGKAVQV